MLSSDRTPPSAKITHYSKFYGSNYPIKHIFVRFPDIFFEHIFGFFSNFSQESMLLMTHKFESLRDKLELFRLIFKNLGSHESRPFNISGISAQKIFDISNIIFGHVMRSKKRCRVKLFFFIL